MLLLSACALTGQTTTPQLISSAGGRLEGKTTLLDWSVGESSVSTMTLTSGYLTEGYQQPSILVIPIARPAPEAGIALTVSPNPTADQIVLRMQSEYTGQLHLRLSALDGRAVIRSRWDTGVDSHTLDLRRLSAATYLLGVFNEDQELLTTYRIIRIK
ncbi:hypothetical protein GGR26_003174 [Lewinella marina]|nr:T9SS type A sorting domain-containing protein [Neolewinella marina]NJB87394.1 hypothetical protein [Neolewinella marina]